MKTRRIRYRQVVSGRKKRRRMTSSALRTLCFGKAIANDKSIAHAFEDDTHNACCLMGPKSSSFNEKNNPIGEAAAKLRKRNGLASNPTAMNPWSTCMGSAVCSNYNAENGDTIMKFAVDPEHTKIFWPPHGTVLTPACEKWLQEHEFKGRLHGTPGVRDESDSECPTSMRKLIRQNIVPLKEICEV